MQTNEKSWLCGAAPSLRRALRKQAIQTSHFSVFTGCSGEKCAERLNPNAAGSRSGSIFYPQVNDNEYTLSLNTAIYIQMMCVYPTLLYNNADDISAMHDHSRCVCAAVCQFWRMCPRLLTPPQPHEPLYEIPVIPVTLERGWRQLLCLRLREVHEYLRQVLFLRKDQLWIWTEPLKPDHQLLQNVSLKRRRRGEGGGQ